MPPLLLFPLGIGSTELANPLTLPENAGPWILGFVAVIVFVDSGVLFPYITGDSLVLAAGVAHERLGIPPVPVDCDHCWRCAAG